MCPTCVKVLAWIAPHQSLLGGEKLWVQGYSIDSRVVRHRFTLFLRIKDQSCRIHLSSSCLQIYLSSLTVVPTSIEHDHSTQAAKRIVGAQGKYEKWGPCYRLYKGVRGHAPRKFWDFTCSEVRSGDFRGSFSHAYSIPYIFTSQLPSSFSGFRLKSMTYRALASGCVVVMQDEVCIEVCISGISTKQKTGWLEINNTVKQTS